MQKIYFYLLIGSLIIGCHQINPKNVRKVSGIGTLEDLDQPFTEKTKGSSEGTSGGRAGGTSGGTSSGTSGGTSSGGTSGGSSGGGNPRGVANGNIVITHIDGQLTSQNKAFYGTNPEFKVKGQCEYQLISENNIITLFGDYAQTHLQTNCESNNQFEFDLQAGSVAFFSIKAVQSILQSKTYQVKVLANNSGANNNSPLVIKYHGVKPDLKITTIYGNQKETLSFASNQVRGYQISAGAHYEVLINPSQDLKNYHCYTDQSINGIVSNQVVVNVFCHKKNNYQLNVVYLGETQNQIDVELGSNQLNQSFALNQGQQYSFQLSQNEYYQVNVDNACVNLNGALNGSIQADTTIAIYCPKNLSGNIQRLDLKQVYSFGFKDIELEEHLIDEQEKISLAGGAPIISQTLSGKDWDASAHAYGEFKKFMRHHIKGVFVFPTKINFKKLHVYGGTEHITIQVSPFGFSHWVDIGSVQLIQNQWNSINLNTSVNSEYLRIKLTHMDPSGINNPGHLGQEMILEGIEDDTVPKNLIPQPVDFLSKQKMKDFMGITSFVNVPHNGHYNESQTAVNKGYSSERKGTEVLSVIREFTMSAWFIQGGGAQRYTDGKLTFQNDWGPGQTGQEGAGTGFDHDFHFEYLKNTPSEISGDVISSRPTINSVSYHLMSDLAYLSSVNADQSNSFNSGYNFAYQGMAPVSKVCQGIDYLDGSFRDPKCFLDFANIITQFSLRYGKVTSNDPNDFYLTDAQIQASQYKSGLDTVDWVEVFNEPSKWWSGFGPWNQQEDLFKNTLPHHQFFDGLEVAAMMSAAYDGHMGTLNAPGYPTIGVKNLTDDPNKQMKVMLPGTVFLELDQALAIREWSKHNRVDPTTGEWSLPFDAINLHGYSNKEELKGFVEGVSPEQDRIRQRMEKNIDLRNRFFTINGKTIPIFVTEWGFDTLRYDFIPQNIPILNNFTMAETQGAWIVRGYLEFLAAKTDVVNIYNIRDERATPGDPEDPNNYHAQGESSTVDKPYPIWGGLYDYAGIVGSPPNETYCFWNSNTNQCDAQVPSFYADYKPKDSYFIIANFRQLVKEMIYEQDVVKPNYDNLNDYMLGIPTAGFAAYKLVDENSNDKAIVAWLPTQNGNNQLNKKVCHQSLSGLSSVRVYSLNTQQVINDLNNSAHFETVLVQGECIDLQLSEMPKVIRY